MQTQTTTSKNLLQVHLPALIFFASIIILSFSCEQKTPAEQYGFLTMLGNDTISVESVTRQGNTLTSDEVDRFPRLRVRHTVVQLNDDGSINHLEMNIHTPSEPTNKRERKVVADVSNNEVHLSKTDSTGTVKRDFKTGGSMMVAHVPQMYSLYELYFAAAFKKTAANTVPMKQFYIDREFDNFPLGDVNIKKMDGNKMDITHDWLSGTGEATMDSSGHLLSYSGERTTYKVNVTRLTTAPDVKSIAGRFETQESNAGGARSLSVRDTARAQVGNANFWVDYGRPLLRGRKLLGDVIPYDYVWRTGANAATQFSTSAPIKIGDINVPAGMYTLWTAPHTNKVDLIINKQTGQWGTEYNGSLDLGVTKMNTETVTTPVEEFTISIVPGKDTHHGTLIIEWGFFKWSAAIEVE